MLAHNAVSRTAAGHNATAKKKFFCKPGVSRDSARRVDSIHVRNDHADVRFRINSVMLPDGVTGSGSCLELPSLIEQHGG